MKRRNFLKGILGAAAIPVVAKAAISEEVQPDNFDYWKPKDSDTVSAAIEYDGIRKNMTFSRGDAKLIQNLMAGGQEVTRAHDKKMSKLTAFSFNSSELV